MSLNLSEKSSKAAKLAALLSVNETVVENSSSSVSQYVGAAWFIINSMMNHSVTLEKTSLGVCFNIILGNFDSDMKISMPRDYDHALEILKSPPRKVAVVQTMEASFNSFLDVITRVGSTITTSGTRIVEGSGRNSTIYDSPYGPADFSLIVDGQTRRKIKYNSSDDYNNYVDLAMLVSGSGVGLPDVKQKFSGKIDKPNLVLEHGIKDDNIEDYNLVDHWDSNVSFEVEIVYPKEFIHDTVKKCNLEALVSQVADSDYASGFGLKIRIASVDMTNSIKSLYGVDVLRFRTLVQFLIDGCFFSHLVKVGEDDDGVKTRKCMNGENCFNFLKLCRYLRRNTILDSHPSKRCDPILFSDENGRFHYNDVIISKLGALWNFDSDTFRNINYVGVTVKGENIQACAVRSHFSKSDVRYYDIEDQEYNSSIKDVVRKCDVSKPIDGDEWDGKLVILDTYADEADDLSPFEHNHRFANMCVAKKSSVVFKYNLTMQIPRGYVIIGYGSAHNGEVFYGDSKTFGEYEIKKNGLIKRLLEGNISRGYSRPLVVNDPYYHKCPIVPRAIKTQKSKATQKTFCDIIEIEGDSTINVSEVVDTNVRIGKEIDNHKLFDRCPGYTSSLFDLFNKDYNGFVLTRSTAIQKFVDYCAQRKNNTASVCVANQYHKVSDLRNKSYVVSKLSQFKPLSVMLYAKGFNGDSIELRELEKMCDKVGGSESINNNQVLYDDE